MESKAKRRDKLVQKLLGELNFFSDYLSPLLAPNVLRPLLQDGGAFFGAVSTAIGVLSESVFKHLLEACRQDMVDAHFTGENFRLRDDGTGNRKIIEVSLDIPITGKDAQRVLESTGHKLVGIKRAMEYVAKHPSAQKRFDLVVLGSVALVDGETVVPVFKSDGNKRLVHLAKKYRGEFDPFDRFLVVRK